MKESVLKIPTHDNDGNALDSILESVLHDVCSQFGGFSLRQVIGGWINEQGKLYRETVNDVVIAMVDNADNDRKLLELAARVKIEAMQEAVYVKLASGTVKII